MPIKFSRKFSYIAGVTTLLLTTLTSCHLNLWSTTQLPSPLTRNETAGLNNPQLAQNYLNSQISSLADISAIPQPSPNFPHPSVSQQNLSQQVKPTSASYPVIDEWKKYQYSVAGNQVLSSAKLPNTKVNFNQADLLTVLINTRKYFQEHSQADADVLRPGILATQGVTVADILKTLDFMITVLREDIANKRTTRLQDPNFINNNFRVIKWTAHNPEKPKQKQLRLTKYAVFTHTGSRKKTSTYNIPLYALKDNLSGDKFYTKYTKQDVLSGIYEPNGKEFGKVDTLAYLTRQGLEEALMQGTILINFTDGSKAFFNVDRNNGMSFIRGLKPTAQKRYWYFKQVDNIKGYGYKIDAKISIKPGVTFAGDVLNIGLGRLIVLEHNKGGRKNLQMGVMADTGGAFLPNLYQLDFLAGIFQNQREFRQYIGQLPEYVTAYFLVKK
jgi:hypothetical protein